MEVNDLKSRITYYKEQISAYAYHPYLSRYIKEPVIDEDKLISYIHLFDHLSERKHIHDNYLLSVMFVQMALDTHDYVAVDNREQEVNEVRRRQLTVLAGDFYSGLYYHLLSLIDDLPFIQVLAKTIREVNEQKVRLYYGKHGSLSSYIKAYKDVETLLAFNVWCHFMPPEECSIIVENIYIKSLSNWNTYNKQSFPKPHQSQEYEEEMGAAVNELMNNAYDSFIMQCNKGNISKALCARLEGEIAQEFS
ncbi:heptaprenyl diphosphate synthase component 1 [Salimicrobium flavidum]|uniref:Heptaprenyl diphosphate synthase (HEPPP synthase) subunit 1 n=1 Tax=Salimicrobium flavidum TaxID=570947 RepID=A0A1N7IJF0_9BACI|nr:heptaprenyl diphosphate synthase component 1 [Salimicrobium flavidum]SIS37126.1 Heptaprenyl diphosphate synthase (HEPPP synthase) subunit 1 [Salimicrobium flavidum]